MVSCRYGSKPAFWYTRNAEGWSSVQVFTQSRSGRRDQAVSIDQSSR